MYFSINMYKYIQYNIRINIKCIEQYAALHILSTGRSPCLLNAMPLHLRQAKAAWTHLDPWIWHPGGAKRAEWRCGEPRGDDHLMDQLWRSQDLQVGGTSRLLRQERPGAIGTTDHMGTLLNNRRIKKQPWWWSSVWTLLPPCLSVGPGQTPPLHGRSCELVSGPAIPQRITRAYGEGWLEWGRGWACCRLMMKRPLIYLKRSQWEVAFHPLHHLSGHSSRKASFKVQSGATETGEDHYEPINSLFTGPPCFSSQGAEPGPKRLGKGPLMSTSKSSKAKSGLMVSMVILFTPPLAITHDARTSSSAGMLQKWIRCSGPLWVLPGVMGKKKKTPTKLLFTALARHELLQGQGHWFFQGVEN